MPAARESARPARPQRRGAARAAAAAVPIEGSAFFRLARVVNLTARPFHEGVGKAHGLSLNEWRVMLVLARQPDITATGIGFSSGLDKMSVSRAVAALERNGRLARSPDRRDARCSRLRLSAAGRRLMALLAPQAIARERLLLHGLSAAEQAQLRALLDRLAANLLEAETSPRTADRRAQ